LAHSNLEWSSAVTAVSAGDRKSFYSARASLVHPEPLNELTWFWDAFYGVVHCTEVSFTGGQVQGEKLGFVSTMTRLCDIINQLMTLGDF
jgi:hypothetical protein